MSCAGEYRYLGPDGDGIGGLPAGAGAAIGSEYCVHLLPTAARMAALVEQAAAREAPLLLLTPYFRDVELKVSLPLFRAIPEGAPVDVAVNDWGLLATLHGLFPRMRLSLGRLLSGRKRCPRIGASPRLTEAGRAWHGEGIFSSLRARAYLEETFGVTGYHVDDLPWSRPAPEDAGRGTAAGSASAGSGTGPSGTAGREENAPFLFVHAPYAIVTVSDTCPWIGGKSSAEVSSCPRPCRNGHVILREPSMGGDILLKGKARFTAPAPASTVLPGPSGSACVLKYADPP